MDDEFNYSNFIANIIIIVTIYFYYFCYAPFKHIYSDKLKKIQISYYFVAGNVSFVRFNYPISDVSFLT